VTDVAVGCELTTEHLRFECQGNPIATNSARHGLLWSLASSLRGSWQSGRMVICADGLKSLCCDKIATKNKVGVSDL
jgi:hypothetical protein